MKRTVYIDDDIWREARKTAIDLNISASALVERALILYLVRLRRGGKRAAEHRDTPI